MHERLIRSTIHAAEREDAQRRYEDVRILLGGVDALPERERERIRCTEHAALGGCQIAGQRRECGCYRRGTRWTAFATRYERGETDERDTSEK